MSTDISTEGRELLIVKDGRVKRSPVPDGFSPAMFRHVVAGVDLLYRRTGAMPTIDDTVRSWEEFDRPTVQKIWATPEFRTALENRGIHFDPKLGLTTEQLYALQILQDPTDGRTTKAKLEAVGIQIGKYRAWMRNPIFAGEMSRQAEANLVDGVPMALNKLLSNAESGDQRAIEKVLEISGRHDPQQKELQNARVVVLSVVEALQEELADQPDTLNRIMSRLQGKMAVLSVTQAISK